MTYIVVEPGARIGGHLRIEAEVDGVRRNDAWRAHLVDAGRRELARVKVL